jgi:hypothetical protein
MVIAMAIAISMVMMMMMLMLTMIIAMTMMRLMIMRMMAKKMTIMMLTIGHRVHPQGGLRCLRRGVDRPPPPLDSPCAETVGGASCSGGVGSPAHARDHDRASDACGCEVAGVVAVLNALRRSRDVPRVGGGAASLSRSVVGGDDDGLTEQGGCATQDGDARRDKRGDGMHGQTGGTGFSVEPQRHDAGRGGNGQPL